METNFTVVGGTVEADINLFVQVERKASQAGKITVKASIQGGASFEKELKTDGSGNPEILSLNETIQAAPGSYTLNVSIEAEESGVHTVDLSGDTGASMRVVANFTIR